MTFQKRARRWPSAWQVALFFGPKPMQDMVVEFRNVSASGCMFVAPLPLPIGTAVRFTVVGREVSGQVVRCVRNGGAIAFARMLTRRELANLCQVRALDPSSRAAQKEVQSDADLRRAISNIL